MEKARRICDNVRDKKDFLRRMENFNTPPPQVSLLALKRDNRLRFGMFWVKSLVEITYMVMFLKFV